MDELLPTTPTNQSIPDDRQPPPIIRQPIFASNDRVYALRATEVANQIEAVNIGYSRVNLLTELNNMAL